jgi:hypothetical protein
MLAEALKLEDLLTACPICKGTGNIPPHREAGVVTLGHPCDRCHAGMIPSASGQAIIDLIKHARRVPYTGI